MKFAQGVKYITQLYSLTLRNVLLGASLCHAVEQKEYHHIPIIVVFPSVYSGYHLFANRSEVKVWLKDLCPKRKGYW